MCSNLSSCLSSSPADNPGALATLDTLTFGDVEFFVDEHARALYVRGPVDREKQSSYTFEVQVRCHR